MKNRDRVDVLPARRIATKQAHIVGGSIAGLAAAAYLVHEARMPAGDITVYASGETVQANAAEPISSRYRRDYHSLLETTRYLGRFATHPGDLPQLRAIQRTQYDEQDSIIQPLREWLDHRGVRFRTITHVRDIETEDHDEATVATALVFDDATGRHRTPLTQGDLVLFTRGPMTQIWA